MAYKRPSRLTVLKEELRKTENHIKVQARNTETQIKEQFQNLRRFLQEEEEARIAALREEEAQKSREVKERIEGLSREMETPCNASQAAEDQPSADDHVSFPQNYKTTMEGVRLSLQDPPPVSGALIDEAKHLKNLAFRVWYKMKDIVSYTPVILDPNTAYPALMLSDDLTSVRCDMYIYVERNEQLPDNPERFSEQPLVLGSKGFNSGCHSWDVEVGDNKNWEVGVCGGDGKDTKKYDPSRGRWGIRCVGYKWDPKYGYKAFALGEGVDWELIDLSVNQKLRVQRRIRVQLDWDRGQLSFHDPDSNTHLHTFTHTFNETLFPCIRILGKDDMKMLPGKICVTLENHS